MGKEFSAELYGDHTGEESYYRSDGWYKKYKDNYKERVSMIPIGVTKILDLGCGVGFLGPALIEAYGNVDYLGVDFSEGMIRRAKKLFPDLEFIVGDLRDPEIHKLYSPEYVHIFRETLEKIEKDLEVLEIVPPTA